VIIVGLPYTDKRLTTLAGGDGSRMTSENELGLAELQGKHVAEIAVRLVAKAS